MGGSVIVETVQTLILELEKMSNRITSCKDALRSILTGDLSTQGLVSSKKVVEAVESAVALLLEERTEEFKLKMKHVRNFDPDAKNLVSEAPDPQE